MKQSFILSLLFALVLGLFVKPLFAQFTDGIVITEPQLTGRGFHLSSKESGFPLLRELNGDVVAQTNPGLDEQSTFVIEDGQADGSGWTADARYFYIRSVSSGRYLTVFGTSDGSPVQLDSLYPIEAANVFAQQFELTPAPAGSGWYKLRSRLSNTGPDLVLEVAPNGQLIASTPHVDPAQAQKFAFNLALPSSEQRTFRILGINSAHFISGSPFDLEHQYVRHNKRFDYACLWQFKPAGNGYYFIFNVLSQRYLTSAGSTGEGDTLFTTATADDFARWQLVEAVSEFKFINKASGHYLGTKAQTDSGRPIFQTTASAVGIQWIVSWVLDDDHAVSVEYDGLLDGAAPPSGCLIYGPGFKRGLAERVGLTPDEHWFPLLRTALERHFSDASHVDKALQNFKLDNPGHRAELAVAFRTYMLNDVAKRSPGTWSPLELEAINYFQGKIQNSRLHYAQRLQQAWTDFENHPAFVNHNGQFSSMITNLQADDFAFPDEYDPQSLEQIGLLGVYVGKAATLRPPSDFHEQIGFAIPAIEVTGFAPLINMLIASKFPAPSMADALKGLEGAARQAAAKAAAKAMGRLSYRISASVGRNSISVFTSALTSAGTVIDVFVIAAEILVMEVLEQVELTDLENEVNNKIFQYTLPVNIYTAMNGLNMLDKIKVYQDMDFLIGAPTATGTFQNNFNDSQSIPETHITCIPNIVTVQLDQDGIGFGFVEDLYETTFACGDILSVSPTLLQFGCGNVGANAVQITAETTNGPKTCTANIQVIKPPVSVSCLQNVPVYLDASGHASITGAQVANIIGDVCGSSNVSILTATTFDCNNIGFPNPVSVLVSNGVVTNQCTASVLVTDAAPPVAHCKNLTLQLGFNGTASLTASQLNDGSTDNCSLAFAPFSASQTAFNCSDVGQKNVTLTVHDASGNTDNCISTIEVLPTVPSLACLQNVPVSLDANNQVSISPAQVVNLFGDPCGANVVLSYSSNLNCSSIGFPTPVSVLVSNGTVTNQCTASVVVTDAVPPTALCKNLTLPLGFNGTANLSASQLNDGSTDNCALAFSPFSASKTAFNCTDVGQTLVTLTVSDVSGNTADCTANITVVDNTPPIAICQNVTVNSGEILTPEQVLNPAMSLDFCGFGSMSLSQTSFDCPQSGQTNTVTLTVSDVSGNTATCSAQVAVVDNIPPVANCQSVTLTLNASGIAELTPEMAEAGSTDNCGIAFSDIAPRQFTCTDLPFGNSAVLTVRDAAGNESFCGLNVQLLEAQPSSVTCPANLVLTSAPGLCGATANFTLGITGTCTPTFSQTAGLPSGAQFPVGTTTNVFQITHADGSTSSCSFTVKVNMAADPNLLQAYTMIGIKDVKLKGNTIQTGGIGIVTAGKTADLKQGTQVTGPLTFVKAPAVSAQGGSQATTIYPGAVPASLLPTFQNHAGNCQNEVEIPNNATVTLPLACYKKVEVGENATVIFSGQATVNLKKLVLKNGAKLFFAQNTAFRVKEKFELKKNNTVGDGNFSGKFFAEEDVEIGKGALIRADIYSLKKIKIEDARNNTPNQIAGLFIADKIEADDNTIWQRNENGCSGSGPGTAFNGNNGGNLVAQNEGLIFSATKKGESETDLRWISKGNEAADFFVVERTDAGLSSPAYSGTGLGSPAYWQPILKTDVLGNADELLYFNELDKNPLAGENFYRLKMVLKNGEERFSNIQKVVFPTGDFTVYPNPTSGETIHFWAKKSPGVAADLKLVNAFGQVLQTRHFEKLEDTPVVFDLQNLPAGPYFFQLNMDGQREIVRRFVVQRP